ncbi:MAG TPA: flavin reductase family protein [Longimicrobium sp.]|nr:flavin reductase family protein [Longimicrobium sp.]
MIEPTEFRRVMGHFATGVCVVTCCREKGAPCGLTVSAVASLSLDPVLVLVCIEKTSGSHRWIERGGAFAVNVLAVEDEALARRFAGGGAPGDRFGGVEWRTAESGAPVLESSLAWLDCRVTAALPGGDHTIFVGRVLDAGARPGTPLVYYRGGFGSFQP